MQLALASEEKPKGWRFRLPPAVPPFNTRIHRVFSIIWIAAFLLAIVGPAAGIYLRYTAPKSNSQLLLGSRAGIAVSPRDATKVRFIVGDSAREAGLKRGDQIIAIFGLPLPRSMPFNEEALAEHEDDPAYVLMENVLFGTEESEVPLTVRDTDGQVRDVTVITSEEHIDSGASSLGISPTLLSFIDLLPVLSYPFLLWAAWILHRRNARDAVSSILSLAVLLTIGSEQPSSTFLAIAGVPRALNVGLFDMGNILLLAGILLFPHGRLSWRLVALLCALPVLLFLQGTLYHSVFISFMVLAVLMLLRCMRATPSSDLRQQIRWALFGFTGYALFRALSIAGDFLKWSTSSFGSQMLVEMLAGVALALGVLVLQAGLLVALLRYRLYDAEAIISRTASIAIVTILLGAAFAGVMEGIITQMQNIYPDSQTPAAMIGAMVAVMLIEPVHRKVTAWAEKRFHKSLLELKVGLPEAMRDLRDVTNFEDFIDEVLTRVAEGVLARRVAFVLGREVKQQIGVTRGEVLRWLAAFQPGEDEDKIECVTSDPLFPLRVRVEDGSGALVGWLLIGPRPDGSIAGKDEREALENIVVPLARSLRIVLSRASEKKEMLDLLESHRQRIERIELALGV